MARHALAEPPNFFFEPPWVWEAATADTTTPPGDRRDHGNGADPMPKPTRADLQQMNMNLADARRQAAEQAAQEDPPADDQDQGAPPQS